MAGMLKAAGALLAAGVAVFAVFFCLGYTQAQTALEQAAVQQSEGLVQADGGDDVSDGYSLLFPDLNAEAITAIVCSGDCIGAVVICGKEEETFQQESIRQLAQTAAQFLGKQME